ncbi:MAG: hypothetical protein WKF75_19465, partial [Singulisphaera sp.]
WRRAKYAAFRPLTVAIVALVLLASKWFDWWGGWCFGYRPIVDTMPLLALLLIPALDGRARRPAGRIFFGALLAWSVAVQLVGAIAIDTVSWNHRVIGYQVDLPGGQLLDCARSGGGGPDR